MFRTWEPEVQALMDVSSTRNVPHFADWLNWLSLISASSDRFVGLFISFDPSAPMSTEESLSLETL